MNPADTAPPHEAPRPSGGARSTAPAVPHQSGGPAPAERPPGGTGPEATTPGPSPEVDDELLTLSRLAQDDPARSALRDRVVERHLPLVHHLARRFRDRGEPHDDLVQVGTIGLLKAVDRFDPDRGVTFASYAVPTIVGEIKRHFRDRGWALRVPRRLQDLGRELSDARATLTQDLGRAPTVDELSAATGVDPESVLEALESANAYATVPLDPPPGESGVVDRWGSEDAALETVENREALRPLLAQLPARERRILALRFVRGMSQSQIAAEVGISQMHVSRLLARTLATLRAELSEDDA
jgi:RNA polymerase sigma-B factor